MATHHRFKIFLAVCLFTVLICSTVSAVSVCNNKCVNLMTDNNNCGTCGNVCDQSIGGSCTNGICHYDPCVGVVCPIVGTGCCGGRCVDLTSRDNCGTCGKKCSLGQYCRNGWCRSRFVYTPGNLFEKSPGSVLLRWCSNDTTGCNNKCVDLMTDPDNCGACGNVCDKSIVGSMCKFGACKVDCSLGGYNCNNNKPDGCEKPKYGDACNCNGASCYIPGINTFGKCENLDGCLSDLTCNNELNPWDVDCSMTTGEQHVNVYSDIHNCGGCGFKCGTYETCFHSTCI